MAKSAKARDRLAAHIARRVAKINKKMIVSTG
jgi:hypothetical protein